MGDLWENDFVSIGIQTQKPLTHWLFITGLGPFWLAGSSPYSSHFSGERGSGYDSIVSVTYD